MELKLVCLRNICEDRAAPRYLKPWPQVPNTSCPQTGDQGTWQSPCLRWDFPFLYFCICDPNHVSLSLEFHSDFCTILMTTLSHSFGRFYGGNSKPVSWKQSKDIHCFQTTLILLSKWYDYQKCSLFEICHENMFILMSKNDIFLSNIISQNVTNIVTYSFKEIVWVIWLSYLIHLNEILCVFCT